MSQKQIIFLSLLTLTTTILSFAFWSTLISEIDKPSVSETLISIAITISWLSSLSLLCLLNDRFWLSFVVSLLSSVTILSLGLSPYTLAATALVFVCLLWLNYAVGQNQKVVLRASLSRLLSPLTTTISLLALTLALLYFPLAFEKSRTFHFQIPDQIFNGLLQNLAASQGNLDPTQENLNKQILDPAPIKKLVEGQLDGLIRDYRDYLPFVLSASVYFTLNLFSLPIYFLSLLLSQISLGLLRLARLVVMAKENIEVEHLKLT